MRPVEEKRVYDRDYYWKNKDMLNTKRRETYWKQPERERAWRVVGAYENRLKLIEFLGGQCAFCSEKDEVVLEVDHKCPVLGNRAGSGMSHMWQALRVGKENPFNLVLVCSNCHSRKTWVDGSHAIMRGAAW